jgi:hypothetical protein
MISHDQLPSVTPHTCFAIIYLRENGTVSGRIDYYNSAARAQRNFDKMNTIHGPHPNGNPRWRLAQLVERV